MSVIAVTRPTTTAHRALRTPLWRAGFVATVLAALATEVYAGVIRAAGVRLAVGNIGGTAKDVVKVGPGACAIMVVMCVGAGLVVAAAHNRWAKRPEHTFLVTACALTVVSFAPDVFAGATAASSKIVLIGAHLLAAAIVIPIVYRSLKTQR